MLFPAVHLPHLYREVPAEPGAAQFYYSLLSAILWEARDNGLILVDQGDSVGKEILRLVDRWPMPYREKAKTQLKKLKKDGRFVEVPVTQCAGQGDSGSECQRALAVAVQEQPPMTLGADGCRECQRLGHAGGDITSVGRYVVSEYALRRRRMSIALSEREWTKNDFENAVLQPIFRYAKHVKIFDRNVGRTLIHWNPEYQQEMVDADVRGNYRRTLEWIFEQFVKMTDGRPARRFEVTCGLKSGDEATLRTAAGVLRQFAAELTTRYGFPMTMKVKRETRAAHMRHDRFIITDQIALMVGRGFDLLTDDGLIRDTVITYVSNPGEIEREAWDLPDA